MNKFRGAFVAIVTPFIDGKLDEQGLKDLIEFQIASGTHGIVPCGTTGESATMSHAEHHRVVELTIKTVAGRVPVLAGTGSNSTSESIELTRAAKEAGADGALMITPYYNKPSQEGLYQHFKAVAEAVDIPIILYNVPSRTAVNMLPETVARCAQIANIVGVKEATADLNQISQVIRLCPKDFAVMSGDDFTSMPTVMIGGTGVISVTSNVAPKDMAAMMDAALAGDIASAQELHYKLLPADAGDVHRHQPGPGQDGPGDDGQDQVRLAAVAPVQDERGQRGEAEEGSRRLRAGVKRRLIRLRRRS